MIMMMIVKECFQCGRFDLHSKCSGCPPKYNGLPCASTTVYVGSGSACGCFDSWAQNTFTAAANEAFMVRNVATGLTWCLRRCGECYRLTQTGGYITGQSSPSQAIEGRSIIIMLVDTCPVQGNEYWCGSGMSSLDCEVYSYNVCEKYQNNHGYLTHFDLHNDNGQIVWGNAEVTYERVVCPNVTRWDTCQCNGRTQPFDFDKWRYVPVLPDWLVAILVAGSGGSLGIVFLIVVVVVMIVGFIKFGKKV